MMSPDIAHAVLVTLAIYLGIGAIVAVPFVISKIDRIDPSAKAAGWTFRAFVFPGAVALWPILLRRMIQTRSAR